MFKEIFMLKLNRSKQNLPHNVFVTLRKMFPSIYYKETDLGNKKRYTKLMSLKRNKTTCVDRITVSCDACNNHHAKPLSVKIS